MSENEVRKRTGTVHADSDRPQEVKVEQRSTAKYDKDATRFGVVDVLRMLLGVLVLSSAMSWFVTGESIIWGWKPWFTDHRALQSWLRGPIHLTDAELSAFDGTDMDKPIYVGLNGSIYDVTASRQTYGPGGSYSFFAGRDAARAFITGCFKEDLTADMRGIEEMYIPIDSPTDSSLTKGELKIRRERENRVAKKRVFDGINGWAKVFQGETGRPYFKVGEIEREDGWLEKLPIRTLCEAAVKSRPTRTAAKS